MSIAVGGILLAAAAFAGLFIWAGFEFARHQRVEECRQSYGHRWRVSTNKRFLVCQHCGTRAQ